MINSVLVGDGYWGKIVKEKVEVLTNLLFVADSKTDLDSLKDSKVEIVFVCSSTASHYDVVKKCLDNDIEYIFCEKPFTGDFEKAAELFSLAQQSGAHIFVDNVFLFRKEILEITLSDIKSFRFVWNKLDVAKKDNLYDSLLYHDLYLLLKLSGISEWNINSSFVSDSELFLKMDNGNKTCVFKYNRDCPSRLKLIFLDNQLVDLSYPANDPLSECIVDMLDGNIDYDFNKEITLGALRLMDAIKKQLL